MGTIDITVPSVAVPVDTPSGFVVTPGLDDLDHGSERPDRSVLGAAFRQDNSVGSFLSNEVNDSRFAPVDPNFKPWDKIKGTKYEARWKSFVDVSNEAALEQVKRQLDKEDEDRKTLAAAPWYQSLPAQMLAGGLDWPTLIPGGTFVRGAGTGYSVARTAASVAGAAGFATAVQESALHSTQETRGLDESLLNIGASMALGGLLGAGGAKILNKLEWDTAVKSMDADLDRLRSGTALSTPQSAGAAAVEPIDLEGNAIAGKAASAVAAATARLNPALRILQSPSPATRDIGTQLFENSLYLKQNLEGQTSGPAAETLMKEWNAGLARSLAATDNIYADYRKAGGPLGRVEFREAIGRAMRRGDEGEDPHISKAAKEWRSKVFDPLKDQAIELGLLPKDVKVETAASYLTRMWNRNKLIAREPEFKSIVENWVGQESPKWAEQFDKGAERRLVPLRSEIDELEMAKLRRAEELRQRSEAGEIEAGEFGEADIRSALRIVEGGAPKPRGVKTLTQFLHEQGGLADIGGELNHLGITNRTRPGFVRARDIYGKGGMSFDDAATRAWEEGYFPHHNEPPSINEFLEALGDDFHKTRAVLKAGDQDAYRLNELVAQLEADLHRVGARSGETPRFATSEEVKGIVARVYAAMDAESDRKLAALRTKLTEREAEVRMERESRFIGNPKELGRQIADEVFDKLTGRTTEAVRPEFITIKARGPLKERTFNIPDELIEDFLESDVDVVGRRYSRVMGADVELARKFGNPDMTDQIQKIRDDYKRLRAGVTDEKELTRLSDAETADVRDIEALRDLLRGTRLESPIERNYGRLMRAANMVNYIRSMGEVVLASLTDAIRPAMVHGLGQFMQTVPQLVTNLKAVKMSVDEARLAGNVVETVLGHRLATLSEIVDPYASRGPVEAFLENATNVASKWNGIRIWTDMMKSVASVMTQNRILSNIEQWHGGLKAYHGSPHSFEAFSLDKVGTGEGAQAYGHGLYFAENPDVARQYRHVGGAPFANASQYVLAKQGLDHAQSLGLSGKEADVAAQKYLHDAAMAMPANQRQPFFDAANNYDHLINNPPGSLYEARITADPKKFLDWDKPLAQQSKAVRDALNAIDNPMFKAWKESGAWDHVSGETLYRELAGGLTNKAHADGKHVEASRLLNEAGIVGIKYLDQGSRKTGEGSRNIVLFDDKLVEVAKRDDAVMSKRNLPKKERDYLAYLGIDESMAERIAKQFAEHGETIDGVRVANTESWTDPVAVRTYRAAMNKDVDSIIVQKGVADVPLFASTPTGRMLLQFKSFALASHQRILLRGLQEDQTRFLGGMVAMTAMGMAITYLKAVSGNRTEKQSAFNENPGWWIAEGLDRSGVLSVPMELANTFERATGANPIKGPLKVFDEGNALSQKMQNRNEVGALLGPTVGAAQDIMVAGGIPKRMYEGEDVTQAQKNALERLAPFNSFPALRQMLRYIVNDPED